MANNLYSHHIFIFPFKWDVGLQKEAFSVRTDLKHLDENMKIKPSCSFEGLNKIKWQAFKFEIKSPKDFNEWNYFYPPVRDVLFAWGGNAEKTVRQYHIHKSDKKQHLELRITLQPQHGCTPLHLEIEEITLTFYETGVGFFGFHLNNYQHKTAEEVLKINDFGRRIYPQFLGDQEKFSDAPKGVFLADSISIYAGGVLLKEENFSSFDSLSGGHDNIVDALTPAHIRAFLPDFLKFSRQNASPTDIVIESLVDDRMFTICWTGNTAWAKGLNASNYKNPKNEFAKLWHRLIFLDGKSPGLANDLLLSTLNENHTNPRWADYGSLYGITRYSFVALTDEVDGKKLVLPHIQSMYFQIALLCLLQRATMLRFSEEIALLVGKAQQRDYLEQAKNLYKKYLHFINKIYFREVTPHEQGIELYRMVQDKMEIPRDVESLKLEIADFHQLLELESGNTQTQAMNTLTIIGSALLVPTIILGYYGVSVFPEMTNQAWFTYCWTPVISGVGMFVGFGAAWLWVKFRAHEKMLRQIIALVCISSVALVFIFSVLVPKWYCPSKPEDPILQNIQQELHQIKVNTDKNTQSDSLH